LVSLHDVVPPGWLLSPAALQVVAERGFAFYELFGGVVSAGAVHAPTVICSAR
jgi:predicted deacetylase